MRRAALALLFVLAACEKAQRDPHATRMECDAYVAAIAEWNANLDAQARDAYARDPNGRISFTGQGVFVGKGFTSLCPERMTSKQVACMIAHAHRHSMDSTACKPEVDLRPPDARRTPEECARYIAKARELAATGSASPRMSVADQVRFVEQGAANECTGWLSRARYECVLAATTKDA
jgi:hypothetical protein